MSEDVFESLVEERIAQLEKIAKRRNALLREMYEILRRRNNVGTVLPIDDDEEDDLHVFLNKCNLKTNAETGYIGHLPDSELFSLVPASPAPSPPPLPSFSKDKLKPRRSTSVISDKASPHHFSKTREPSVRLAPRPLVDHGDSDDELDLIGSPAHRSSSSVPIYVENTPEPIPVTSLDEEESKPDMQTETDEGELVEEEMKEAEVEEANEVTVEDEREDEGEDVIEKELVQEDVDKEQDMQKHEAEEVPQATESQRTEEISSTEEIPLGLSSSPRPDPGHVAADLPQNVFAESRDETENVVMEDSIKDRIAEHPLEEIATASSPLAPKEEPGQEATDDEPMVVDSSPLQPPRQLLETASHQSPLHERPASETPEIAPIEPQPQPSVEMDVDIPSAEETKVTDTILSEVLPEESVQTEVSQPAAESVPEPIASEVDTSKPIRSSILPLPSEYNYGTPEPIVMAEPPSPQFIDPPSVSYSGFGEFNFPSDHTDLLASSSAKAPQPRHPIDFDYPLPPVDSLPIEFNRKRRLKQQKKKEKEREKGESKKDKDGSKDDWAPWGANRWIATIRTNPVHKKVSKATKCLTTRDWNVAMQELKLLRAMEQIERLKSHGRWSFRQPKKQRGVGGLQKTHWDYLMDEMKWMRTDFREERKWKMALAYNLSTAVLEWHAAGTLEKRLKRGICVLWKPPRQEKDRSESQPAVDSMDMEPSQSQNPAEQSLLMLDYGSDDDEEDDQDKDQQSVGDALDTTTLMEDSLQAAEQDKDDNGIGLKDLEPKQEQQDESANLQNSAMDVDAPPSSVQETQTQETQEIQEVRDETMEPVTEQTNESDPTPSGLKSSSSNPVLGSIRKSNSHPSDPSAIPQSKTSRKNLYAPLREKIAYSDFDKLFIDLDDFHITTPSKANPNGDGKESECLLPPTDLPDIFPDLQPYTILDVASSVPGEEKKPRDKKSERDDPNKRIEEAAYTKVYPASKFIHSKPTLISALQPASHFKDGRWTNLDESPIMVEHDGAPMRITELFSNSLFDHKVAPAQIGGPILSQTVPSLWVPKDKDGKPREAPKREHQWSAHDDALLKSLVDKYLNNWELIAESFNAMTQTVQTDRRTSRDCQERWTERFGQDRRAVFETPSTVDAAPSPQTVSQSASNQITTRGVKRGASNSVSSPSIPGLSSEPSTKKRRRHTLMQDLVRKAAKKRIDAMQKINPRKPPITHESHAAYNKMPKMSPADLSRLKADREFNDQQQYQQLARARQQQVQQMQQQQQQQQNGTPGQGQGQGQGRVTPTAQVNGQAQPTGAAPPNGVARTSTSGLQTQGTTVPQIRSQVAQVPISGQQRSNTPFANNRYPAQQNQQQIIRAQQHALSQALVAQMQAQAASAAGGSSGGSQPTPQNGQGSPSYTATNSRDATSSPAGTQGSPPRTSATPSNAVNSPRPLPAQTGQAQGQQPPQQSQTQGQPQSQNHSQTTGMGVQMQPQQLTQAGIAGILQNVQQNGQMGVGIPRANIPGYYLSNVLPNLQSHTPEQLQNIMRLQALLVMSSSNAPRSGDVNYDPLPLHNPPSPGPTDGFHTPQQSFRDLPEDPLPAGASQPRFIGAALYDEQGPSIRNSYASSHQTYPSYARDSEYNSSVYGLNETHGQSLSDGYRDDPHDLSSSGVPMSEIGSQPPGRYLEEKRAAYAAPRSRRRVIVIASLVAAVILILVIVIGVYFGVIKKNGDDNKDSSNSSSGGASNNAGSGGGKTSGTLAVVTGGDGSTITKEDGSTFTYSNKFGGTWYWDPNDPFNNGAQAQKWSPALNETFNYGVDRIRGVNLGGWLTPEPFIVPSLFEPYVNLPTPAIDEWTLSEAMKADTAHGGINQLEDHYKTFITEEDFAEIAGAGLNYVRIALPYWAIETRGDEPFLEGVAWKYFLKAIQWARKYGIRINLDLHTLPGSQNGWNHSGRLGDINMLMGPMGFANAQRSLDYIRVLAEFISQPQYKDVVTLFGITNEPRANGGDLIGQDVLSSYYLQAYDVVRKASGFGDGKGPIVSFHDGFFGRSDWTGFLPNADRISLDTHPYLCFDVQSSAPIDTYATTPCDRWGADVNNSMAGFGLTQAGEWSNAVTDCGKWVNGVNQGIRYEGSYVADSSFKKVGSCDDWTDWQNWDEDTKDAYKTFAMASMDALQNWFFWTWKVGNSSETGKVEAPHWSYKLGLENGWMPTDPRAADGQCKNSSPWEGTLKQGSGSIPASVSAKFPWPPTATINKGGAVLTLPSYTPTGPVPTLSAPTFTQSGVTPTASVNPGNGWFNSDDSAGMMVEASGCSYLDPWVGLAAEPPSPLCSSSTRRKEPSLELLEPRITPAPDA
ncbi:hypothetical protein D9758_001649 [Tetrapyrgos nigripes]|uniref:glucan 1,3-beta-glucosidase n=1 Tax=Tetrapyrgos nigripes TaxID=182062 RepID=A0A8H5LXJ3_9AGAR|nr:hypothetical protein D9758_001649 [Tetrapyrgos nigripes]